MIPFVLLFTVLGMDEILKKINYKNILLFIFLVGFVVFSLVTPLANNWQKAQKQRLSITQDGLDWGKWAAQNIEGKIAIYLGHYLIMMHLPDTVVGGRGHHYLSAPNSNLSVVSYGYFENFNSAMKWFKENGVTHLIVDDNNVRSRPYLKEIYFAKEIPPYLNEVYSNFYTHSKWKVRIFSIDWPEYKKRY
jgi:hypothetical protein